MANHTVIYYRSIASFRMLWARKRNQIVLRKVVISKGKELLKVFYLYGRYQYRIICNWILLWLFHMVSHTSVNITTTHFVSPIVFIFWGYGHIIYNQEYVFCFTGSLQTSQRRGWHRVSLQENRYQVGMAYYSYKRIDIRKGWLIIPTRGICTLFHREGRDGLLFLQEDSQEDRYKIGMA